MSSAEETTLTFFVMLLSTLKQKSCVLHNFDTLRHILIMLVEMKRTSRHVVCKRDNSHFLRCVVISPKAKILCKPKLPYYLR